MTKPPYFYDDGIYKVSREHISNGRRFYPIANTTARIRRDPLWIAIGLNAFAALATITYGDLMLLHELAVMWGIAGLSAYAGTRTTIFHIDAPGHDSALFFVSSAKINELYQAIRLARSGSESKGLVMVEEDEAQGSSDE